MHNRYNFILLSTNNWHTNINNSLALIFKNQDKCYNFIKVTMPRPDAYHALMVGTHIWGPLVQSLQICMISKSQPSI